MNELIQPILALGGFGYLNYLIYSKIDNPDFGSDSDKKFIILLYSSMNYVIFLGLGNFKEISEIQQIFFTIISSFIIMLIMPYLSRLLTVLTNCIRSSLGLTKLENTKLKDKFLEGNENDVIFVFSLPDNNLISSGHKRGTSREFEDFSVMLDAFHGNEEYCRFANEDNLLYFLEDKKVEVKMYINFDRKIKIISFLSAAVEQSSSDVVA